MTVMTPIKREPIHTIARIGEELREPICTEADFLATMKGYRRLKGVPQLAVDHDAGMQDGYIGKLEIGIRRSIHSSFWWWIDSLRLCFILVPVTDAIRADICPCCGKMKG